MTLTWINRRSDPILELQLTNKGEILESLQFNPINESVRIRYDGYHQFFFLDNGNAWTDRVVFNNAYGIEAGRINFDRYPFLSGTIHLDDQEFIFSTHSPSEHTVEVYRAHAPEIRLKALLPLEDNLPEYPVPGKRIEMVATVLLLLCWNLAKVPVEAEVNNNIAAHTYWNS